MKNIANGLASLGRGRDTMLVHMSPREVNGLQTLALASGGSLTINPYTGLYEAGWLENLLPMIAGGALTVASGGTLTPLMAAAITGGGTGLITGDWEKGLMAGLGAFGGASLGAGLTSLGAETAAANAAGAEAALAGASTDAAAQAANQAVQGAMSLPGSIAPEGASAAMLGDAGGSLAANPTASSWLSNAPVSSASQAASASGRAAQGLDQFKTGIGTLRDKGTQGWVDLYNQPTMGMKGTMAAAMPIMGAMSSEEGGDKYKEEPAQYYVTSYNPGQQVQPGVGYIAGQGYSDGYWTEDPKKAVSGSWYGAAGGIPGTLPMPAGPVKPFTSDRDDNLGNYYSNLIGSSVGIGGATVPTPPPTAMTNYLQKVTDTIHAPEQVYQAPTYGQGDGAVMPDSVSSGAQSLAQAMREARQTQNLGQVGRSSSGFVGNALGTFYSPVDKLFNPQGGQPLYKVKKDGTIWFNGADSGKKFYGGTIDPMTGTVSVNNDPNGEWSSMLTNYLRTGEGELPKQAKRFLKAYEHLKGTGWDWRTDSSGQAPSAPVPASGLSQSIQNMPTNGGIFDFIRSRQTAPVGNPADILPNSQGMAGGGITALNSGRLIRGPGDGTSDSIPAQIYGEKPQRAALADGEFVFPARIVSEIGNGSTEAGARKLYSIMDRIQQDRMRTARKGGIAANTNAMRHFNV